ncbi:MAG: cation diffusion facilitator family transporter [Alphaproteobacteria bacterium]
MADHTHHHPHGHGHADSERRLLIGMALTGGFMVVEAVGGWLVGSLALIADAGHMLSDFGALALSWGAFRMSARRADARRTFGYHRAQVLASLANSLALLALGGWIAAEAIGRFSAPVEIRSLPMLVVAAIGLAVNLAVFRVLHGGDRDNLNMRGAALHVLGDLLGSVAAIAAALIIMTTGWYGADPVLSLAVVVLILRSALAILRRSIHILLEGAPDDVDTTEVGRRLSDAVPAVHDVHHVHVWSLSSDRAMMTLHAVVDPGADIDSTRDEIHAAVARLFGVTHVTVQLEHSRCGDPA